MLAPMTLARLAPTTLDLRIILVVMLEMQASFFSVIPPNPPFAFFVAVQVTPAIHLLQKGAFAKVTMVIITSRPVLICPDCPHIVRPEMVGAD